MNSDTWPDTLRVGDWQVRRATGELAGPDGSRRLEPKVMDLLFVLATRPGQVLSREQLLAELWPGQIVGDDSLARTVSKLRQALDDDARAPRYVETIAKRGYRLVAPVSPLVTVAAASAAPVRPRRLPVSVALGIAVLVVAAALAWTMLRAPAPAPRPLTPQIIADPRDILLARADDAYFQYVRADNEAAIELYQRVLGLYPDDASAMAGLANALVQRVMRWPELPGPGAIEFRRLGEALAHGHLAREPARSQLQRARHLAERAIEQAPEAAATHKALGLVASAEGRFDAALAAYRHALELDPDAWGPMINIGDVLGILGRDDEALPWFERAYEAMARVYERNPAQVRPWHTELGVLVAGRHRERNDLTAAEAWYRRVLALSPLHAEASHGLAAVLRQGGDVAAAQRLCQELVQRLGPDAGCD